MSRAQSWEEGSRVDEVEQDSEERLDLASKLQIQQVSIKSDVDA